eukprot:1148622-Pelagomonas_calceolata.AAC.1
MEALLLLKELLTAADETLRELLCCTVVKGARVCVRACALSLPGCNVPAQQQYLGSTNPAWHNVRACSDVWAAVFLPGTNILAANVLAAMFLPGTNILAANMLVAVSLPGTNVWAAMFWQQCVGSNVPARQ